MAESSRYYEEELAYLVDAGREYARLHPERARYLNLTDPRSRDPHIERLIEAVAFLTGAVRQRLDDDFPELTHSLINLVWPHYLRPVPAITMLQLEPLPGMVRGRQVVPKGHLVQSRPTAEGVPCRFRTAYAVDVYPVVIHDAGIVTDDSGAPVLELEMELQEGADPAAFTLDRLRLYIAGEPSVAFATYRLLRTQLASVQVVCGRDRRRRFGPEALRPAGFSSDEDLLPYPRVSFPGYRLLSEYFAFPEKYLFLDLVGLGKLDLDKGERRFSVELRFRQRPPEGFRPTAENFKLYVTPAVNLYSREGDPLRVTQLKTAYRLYADATHPAAYEVVSVEEVTGLRRADGRRRRYSAFLSFDHDREEEEGEENAADGTYYHLTQRISPAGAWTTSLSLISPGEGTLPAEEVLSLRLQVTNGRLCRELGIGDVTLPAGERLDFVRYSNITRPTEPVYPNLGRGTEWRFISHMALNFLTLEDISVVRQLLSLYNTGDRPAHRRRIEGLRSLRARTRELLVRGAPVRGTELELEVDETHFDEEGDLLLFTEVISRFIGMYAGVNSFAQLVVRSIPSGEVLRWPAITGDQKLI